jgi:serine/threonine protein kinase
MAVANRTWGEERTAAVLSSLSWESGVAADGERPHGAEAPCWRRGEVYRARESRLNRHVPIKVLPSDVAADHDSLTRFDREAQVLASLSHPNIANIYGVEDSSGAPALVMELVGGPTANSRCDRVDKLQSVVVMLDELEDALKSLHELKE